MSLIPSLVKICNLIIAPEPILNLRSINSKHRNMIIPVISIQDTITSITLSMSVPIIITSKVMPTSTVVSLLHIIPMKLLLTSDANTITVVVTLSQSSILRMNTVSKVRPIDFGLLLPCLWSIVVQQVVPFI